MKTTISLKQLRTDPREYVRLLNSGFEVAITEHRKPIARAVQPKTAAEPNGRGSVKAVLAAIDNLPRVKTPFSEEDTVKLAKKTRLEYLERKYGYKK